MLELATGQFSIDGQVEDILGGMGEAARIARISQSCRFRGQLEGESVAEYTAVLPRAGDGSFHGFQRITGSLGERVGTFVLSVTGVIQNGQPRGTWAIVPKSGSGDFLHIRGSGTFSLPNGKPGNYRLEFDLRKPRAKPASPSQSAAHEPKEERVPMVEAPTKVLAKKRQPPTAVPPSESATMPIATTVQSRKRRAKAA